MVDIKTLFLQKVGCSVLYYNDQHTQKRLNRKIFQYSAMFIVAQRSVLSEEDDGAREGRSGRQYPSAARYTENDDEDFFCQKHLK